MAVMTPCSCKEPADVLEENEQKIKDEDDEDEQTGCSVEACNKVLMMF